jgi:hypothetical protein
MKNRILIGVGTAALIMPGAGAALSTPTAQALPPQCYQNLGPAVAADCARMDQQTPDGNFPTDPQAKNICQITGACAIPRR